MRILKILTISYVFRYLKSSENHINGEEVQEEETSGGTSGEEIWGTPTSGGEFDDMMNSPNYEGKQSVIIPLVNIFFWKSNDLFLAE